MSRRFLCLHGHFYQPPRENPWLEEVEIQDSAAPFHDWDERICAECYAPNGAARIMGNDGRIVDIVNNYIHLSFNYGPTLLSWIERSSPMTYERIVSAQVESARRREHGNALAQAYSHAILPLCNSRDRRTQIRWGKADFRARFGHEAEGFWLPETAADAETLRDLAREGVLFTVLSPFQALRVRPPGGEWQDAREARFDPTLPYKVELGDGLSIVVFFYDAPIARELAFGQGAPGGEELVRLFERGFDPNRGHDELLVVAVDGETFGHHRKGFEGSLAQAFRLLASREDLQVVNLGQALRLAPAEWWEAEVVDGASWSCAHGLERWRNDCGCSAAGQPGWNQRWRAPLREALDGLRGHLSEIFEREGGRLLADPWAARDDYVELVLARERRDARAFFDRHTTRRLDGAQTTAALKLLEMQRHELLMYTSCGWFFSEISGLETVQILKYAARAIQLAREVSGVDLEPLFKDALSRAPSNLPVFRDGAGVWEQLVRPSVVSLEKVAAHYAIAGAVAGGGHGALSCFPFEVKALRREAAGSATLSFGRLCLQSALVRETLDAAFCVLHFGGSDFRCGLRPYVDPAQQSEAERELFGRLGSLTTTLRQIDRLFVGRDFTLRDLFLDERRRLAALLLRESMRRYESDFVKVFESNRRLMEFLKEIDSPIPQALRAAAEVALTRRLQQLGAALAEGSEDRAVTCSELLAVAQTAQRLDARLDLESVRPTFEALVHERLELLSVRGLHRDPAFELVEIIDLGERLGLHLDLTEAQTFLWQRVASPEAPPLERDTLERLAARLGFEPRVILARAARLPATATPGEPEGPSGVVESEGASTSG